jgi:hypothetical protein
MTLAARELRPGLAKPMPLPDPCLSFFRMPVKDGEIVPGRCGRVPAVQFVAGVGFEELDHGTDLGHELGNGLALLDLEERGRHVLSPAPGPSRLASAGRVIYNGCQAHPGR